MALSQESIIRAIHDSVPEHIIKCGVGDWRSIAFFNMSDRSYRCPSPWREINANGVRACGRPYTSNWYGSCLSASLSLPSPRQMYKKVCGRVIGYEYGSTDAFLNRWNNQNLNVCGVSITHGIPRSHIWTLAAGLTEGAYFDKSVNCPCAHPTQRMNSAVPSLVGNNYYCESGNSGSWFQNDFLYNSDPLWDGEQCEGECCNNGKSPPWFSVELPNPTTDDIIEVRICSLEPTYQDAVINLLNVYVR